MKNKILSACAVVALMACAHTQQDHGLTLTQGWVLDGFENPESVAVSDDGKQLFVSNANGEAKQKDGNGYISKVSSSGEFIEKKWVSGLNSPLGVTLHNDMLFVSDVDQLVQIKVDTAEIVRKIDIEGAQLLNDVTPAHDGGVFASDTIGKSIYHYKDGAVSVWMESERFSGINGLLVLGDNLLVAVMDAGELLSVDLETQDITVISGGIKGADMMVPLAKGGYIVSEWPGVLHHVDNNGERSVIIDTLSEEYHYNDMTSYGDVLFTPNWGTGSVTTFKIEE